MPYCRAATILSCDPNIVTSSVIATVHNGLCGPPARLIIALASRGDETHLYIAAFNPHVMLVKYTGAAGDLPGKIPRKIGPRGRKIGPWDLRPWSDKLHFVMPGRLRTFGSEPGRTCATAFLGSNYRCFWTCSEAQFVVHVRPP
jgi:hypothetical protein